LSTHFRLDQSRPSFASAIAADEFTTKHRQSRSRGTISRAGCTLRDRWRKRSPMQCGLRLPGAWYCCPRQHQVMDITATISSEGATSPPGRVCRRPEICQPFKISMAAISGPAKRERLRARSRSVTWATASTVAPLCGTMPQARRYRDERDQAAPSPIDSKSTTCEVFGMGNVDRVCGDCRGQLCGGPNCSVLTDCRRRSSAIFRRVEPRPTDSVADRHRLRLLEPR